MSDRPNKILLLMPPGWDLKEVWIAHDQHVTKPILMDKDSVEFKELKLGIPEIETRGIRFNAAKITPYLPGVYFGAKVVDVKSKIVDVPIK